MQTLQIKEQLHQYIDVAHESQLQAIYTLLEEKIMACQSRISLEDYNKEIEQSELEYEGGNFITQQEFINETKLWKDNNMK